MTGMMPHDVVYFADENTTRLTPDALRIRLSQSGFPCTATRIDDATIELTAGGQLTARIDCNRGRGTWKSANASQIEFGPLALTRAQCPPGSLHDQIVKQWPFIRTYLLREGRLFLLLMADGGAYEFEPAR